MRRLIFTDKTEWHIMKDEKPKHRQFVNIKFGPFPPCFENTRLAIFDAEKMLFYTDPHNYLTEDPFRKGFITAEAVELWMPIPYYVEWRE